MLVENLATLRAVVAFLGERDQFAWWQSAFFGAGSGSFLSPVFARTQTLAQCAGAGLAAARVHDERIGVGGVFHLFRLPEEMERNVHAALQQEATCKEIDHLIADTTSALHFLNTLAKDKPADGVGPTRVGSLQDLRRDAPWASVAGLYTAGFQKRIEIFPYFVNRS
jgi:hypothetical protein